MGRHFLIIELLIALAAGVAVIAWSERGGWQCIEPFLADNGAAFYSAVASVIGSLLGFTISAVAILISLSSSPALAVLEGSARYPDLWKIFTSAMRYLGLGTAYALLAVLDGTKDHRRPIFYGIVVVLLVCAARVYRTIWVLERFIRLLVSKKGAGHE